jgi:hypothetical protein
MAVDCIFFIFIVFINFGTVRLGIKVVKRDSKEIFVEKLLKILINIP